MRMFGWTVQARFHRRSTELPSTFLSADALLGQRRPLWDVGEVDDHHVSGEVASMNIAFWVLQGLLAAAFAAAGSLKLSRSKEQLLANKQMGWANDFSPAQIKLIGGAELLGALGLILPWALKIEPLLTPIAAVCLVIIMVGAVLTHRKRHEPFAPPLVLAVLLLVIAAGRFAT
jgi:uncharacterized membrane protein YphA (DoxX/SURF4 family)